MSINLEIEDKLNELKEKFCKWNCSKEITIECFNEPVCVKCDSEIVCAEEIEIELCDYCKVQEFINYIRDDI